MSREIPISMIDYGSNIRVEADNDIKELADSIDEHDVLQPLVVRPKAGGRFEVVCGHRRYRALQMMGGNIFVPCEVRADIKDEDVLKIQLEENIQRKQMSAFELVAAMDKMKALSPEKLTNARLAKMLNKSLNWVNNLYFAVNHAKEVYGKSELKKAKKYSAGKIVGDLQKMKREQSKVERKGFSVVSYGTTITIKCETKEVCDALVAKVKML